MVKGQTLPQPTASATSPTTSVAAITTQGPLVFVRDDPDNVASLSRTTLVTTLTDCAVVSGESELQTLTQYTDLRQRLTITTTTTYNGTDGTQQADTAVGVMLAGGATWVLLNFAETHWIFKEFPDGGVDDSGRPEIPPTCARPDCQGTLDFCGLTGPLFGCACEKDKCTDAGLFCNECKWADGKCTSGD
ncbi:Uu.00g129940.m01.CDS01 [Anthostomella pinea]|uniref:Uu.00g129940.m01.CDS01 n=1 Tax=Anthostomella pinea TaxID=933095 RepID=A0AAI8VIL4_9PEZI|nr:Uu.00g129940.m01.CDS01 [Anthostomella pinea]